MPDPCQPQFKILWAQYVKDELADKQSSLSSTLRIDGPCCWCCFRLRNVFYSASMTQVVFKTNLHKPGQDGEHVREDFEKFNAWLAAKVMDYVETHGGSREGMRWISWPGRGSLQDEFV